MSLSLSVEYVSLLRASRSELAATHSDLLPPLPLGPFSYVVFGRLSSLQSVAAWPPLQSHIQALSVKTAIKKCTQPPALPPHLRRGQPQADRRVDVDAVATAAENPDWLQEMTSTMQRGGPAATPCRYLILEDLLHANSISRFHFIIKREVASVASAANAAAAAAAAAAAHQLSDDLSQDDTNYISRDSAHEAPFVGSASRSLPANGANHSHFVYSIQDLGSLNGVYIDGVRLRHRHWTPLREGCRLRFAPLTKNAKNYILALRAAGLVSARAQVGPPRYLLPSDQMPVPAEPLSVKDLHIEYVFSHQMSDACRARVPLLDQPPVKRRFQEGPAMQAQIDAAAAAAGNRVGAGGAIPAAFPRPLGQVPAPAAPPVFHQNLSELERRRAQDARDAAFYSRFSRVPLPEQPRPVEAMQDRDVNDAPVPSNYRPPPVPPPPLAPAPAPSSPVTNRKRTAEEAQVAEVKEESAKRARAATPTRAPVPVAAAPAAAAAAAAGISPARAGAPVVSPVAAAPPAGRARRRTAYHMFVSAHQRTIFTQMLEARRLAGHALQPEAAESKHVHSLATKECAARWHQTPELARAGYQEMARVYNLGEGDSAPDAAAAAAHSPPPAPAPVAMVIAAAPAAAARVSTPPRDPQVSAAADVDMAESKEDEDDDEDAPIINMRKTPPTAAVAIPVAAAAPVAAASASPSVAASSPTTAAVSSPAPAAPSQSTAMAGMLEEFQCGICSDVIYECVVLGCSHSYCKSCINQWFKKKKICPVCREKHKGEPRSVRSADNVIRMMVESMFTAEQKSERQARINLIDAEGRIKAAKDAEKLKEKQARAAAGAAAAAALPMPLPVGPRGVIARRAIQAALVPPARGRPQPAQVIAADDDEDENDEDYEDELEDDEDYDYEDGDGFMAPEHGQHDDEDVRVLGVRRPGRAARAAAAAAAALPSIYTIDLSVDRRTACRICCSIIECDLLRLRQQAQAPAGLPAPPPDHFHLYCFAHDLTQPRLALHQVQGLHALPNEFKVLVASLLRP